MYCTPRSAGCDTGKSLRSCKRMRDRPSTNQTLNFAPLVAPGFSLASSRKPNFSFTDVELHASGMTQKPGAWTNRMGVSANRWMLLPKREAIRRSS